jgi:oxygen-independent coproporphyrinogen-3 oxidase
VPGNDRLVDRFIDALAREWDLAQTAHDLRDTGVSTLFFGGGTPSLFSLDQWQKLHDRLISRLYLSPGCEWSIECNPESFSVEKAAAWKNFGVNRLTFGIQSLSDRELRVLGRVHSLRDALRVLSEPILSEFASIGIDLMYGLPGQTPDSLKHSLDQALSFKPVNHFSAYELTLSDASALGRHQGILPLPDDETIVTMNDLIAQKAAEYGFTRYEISNFSKPGFQCRHNQAYWRHLPYIGLGPSAHSYLPPKRFSNASDILEYCATIESGELPRNFIETIGTETLSREIIFLELRTAEGINEDHFLKRIGKAFCDEGRKPFLEKILERKLIAYRTPFWTLTQRGFLFADGIARELL